MIEKRILLNLSVCTRSSRVFSIHTAVYHRTSVFSVITDIIKLKMPILSRKECTSSALSCLTKKTNGRNAMLVDLKIKFILAYTNAI